MYSVPLGSVCLNLHLLIFGKSLTVWPYHWLQSLKGALPPDQISPQQYPKVFAWVSRFQAAITAAKKVAGPPKTLTGPEAAAQIGSSEYAEEPGSVDPKDPSGLQEGQTVSVWPTDTGFRNRDKGALIKLSTEIVIETSTGEGKVVRVHAPRHGFRVRAANESDGKVSKL
jgi:hypothetical protein